jgi:hypothetical protein
MWIEAEINVGELEEIPVSLDTSRHEALKHIRGFLERDLRPESLWSLATASSSMIKDCFDTVGFKSTNSDDWDRPDRTQRFTPGDILRMSDIENNAEFFLGPPRALILAVPSARPFSKARSWAGFSEYMETPEPRVIPPPPQSGPSSSSGAAVHEAHHWRWGPG